MLVSFRGNENFLCPAPSLRPVLGLMFGEGGGPVYRPQDLFSVHTHLKTYCAFVRRHRDATSVQLKLGHRRVFFPPLPMVHKNLRFLARLST